MKPLVYIIAAQQEELDGFFQGLEAKQDGETVLYEGENYLARGFFGGIGKVSISYRLGKMIQKERPDRIINIGVAGSINPDLKAFDILLATNGCYHDVDCTAFGYEYGQMCQMPLYFPCDMELLTVSQENIHDEHVKYGLILSGDSFITKDNCKSEFFDKFLNPYAVDMESAAVLQCALIEKIPCNIIRAISDDATSEENKEHYEFALQDASIKAGKLAHQLLDLLYIK